MNPDSSKHDPSPEYLRALLDPRVLSLPAPRPATGAQRQAKLRASGRQVAVVLRDPAAIAALDRLSAALGGVTLAVTAALKSAR